jgi:hypothetical protein
MRLLALFDRGSVETCVAWRGYAWYANSSPRYSDWRPNCSGRRPQLRIETIKCTLQRSAGFTKNSLGAYFNDVLLSCRHIATYLFEFAHSKAMPVQLISKDEREFWLMACMPQTLVVRRLAPDAELRVVSIGKNWTAHYDSRQPRRI